MLQYITTDAGEELVVLSKRDYDALAALAAVAQRRRVPTEAEEDAGGARIIARARENLAAGRDIELPADVAFAIAEGENAIKALRKWRGMTQGELADAAGLKQGYISSLENGERKGPTATIAAIAKALEVPINVLV